MSAELPRPALSIETRGAATIVRLPADFAFKEETMYAIGSQLQDLADQPGRHEVLLDLSDVDNLTSAALAGFLKLQKKLQQRGGRLVLAHANAAVREVLAVTYLDRVFEVRPAQNGAGQSP
jgi:anti-anti-sigma factor